MLDANPDILALAAPQIGINKRIFCLRFNDQIKVFINPIITKKKGLTIAVETCCSMPGKEIVIGRPEEVTVVYYNEEFKYEDNKLLGAAASLLRQRCAPNRIARGACEKDTKRRGHFKAGPPCNARPLLKRQGAFRV